MLLIFLRTCTRVMVVLAVALVPSFCWAFKIVGDVYFDPGSSVLSGEQIDYLDQQKCKAGSEPLKEMVIIGHASPRERNAKNLSLARALAVKEWLVANTGWDPNRIHAEGKGARQPVADDATDVGSAKNRRVELESIGDGTYRYSHPSAQCRLVRWESAFLAPEGDSAMVVARSLARTGWVRVPTLYRSALQHRRDDLFTRLPHAGIATTPRQRIEIAGMALAFGKFDYFTVWLRREGRTLDGNQRDALLQAACKGEGSAAERAAAIRLLHAAGAVSRTPEGLQCAVIWAPQAPVAEAYLAGGAQRFIDADMVVAAGRNPAVLERLLAWGGNPASRTVHGTTLFHTSRLKTVADVQRLLDWSLDINAKGRTFPSNSQTTPLREALGYASVEVLDFMKQAGADISSVEGGEPLGATRIIANQLWLLRNGAPLLNAGDAVVSVARQGDAALPVLEALRERGVDLGATGERGMSALGVAIEGYAPALVRFLVARGVPLQVRTLRDAALRPALEVAKNLSEMVPQPAVMSHDPRPRAVPFPSVMDPERQRKRNEILQILSAAAS
jgi:hypothetical protein